jgi:hypothetical protein
MVTGIRIALRALMLHGDCGIRIALRALIFHGDCGIRIALRALILHGDWDKNSTESPDTSR